MLKLKISSLLTILLITSCAKQEVLDPIEVEQEFAQEKTEQLKTHELTDVKNPELFVKYYLRSKFNLYNSNSLNSIANSHYKLALENPENIAAQEQAFLLLLASQNYAKALTISQNKLNNEGLTFEELFNYAQKLAQDDIDAAHQILAGILADQHRLPFLKIIDRYFLYQDHKDIDILKEDIFNIKSSLSLDGFKYYYVARAYEAQDNFEKAFEFYYTAFAKHNLRTEDVFSRMIYTANQIDPQNAESLIKSNSKYGKNLYLVDQAFVNINTIKPLDNSLKAVSAQALFDLGWSINQTTAGLAGLDFLAIADYIKPNDKHKFQLAKGYYANTWKIDAIELLELVKPSSNYYLSAQIVLADMVKLDDAERAIQIIKNLQKKKLFNSNYLEGILGQIYMNEDKFKHAIVSFTKALEHDESPKTYFSRAVAYEKTNQIDKALKDLKTALELNPKNPIVLNYLGYLLIDINQQPTQGLEYIEQAVRLDPTSAASLDSLGWAYIKLGKYNQGLIVLEKAYETAPQDGVITGHLGDAYLHTNRKAEAIVYWKKALELEENDKREINRIKKQLHKHHK